jgi:hypothetical protein
MNKTCDRCKHWEPPDKYDIELGHTFNGSCNCDKFQYQNAIEDGLAYWDAESFGAGFNVGPKFGCIHWKEK